MPSSLVVELVSVPASPPLLLSIRTLASHVGQTARPQRQSLLLPGRLDASLRRRVSLSSFETAEKRQLLACFL